MKRYVGKLARAVLEKGRELDAAPFARVWADADEPEDVVAQMMTRMSMLEMSLDSPGAGS